MNSGRLSHRIAIVAGGGALVAMSTLTACSPSTEKDAPSSTSATVSTSQAAPSPTEKAVGPGTDNSFSPSVNPQPPGAVCTKIENGVCVR